MKKIKIHLFKHNKSSTGDKSTEVNSDVKRAKSSYTMKQILTPKQQSCKSKQAQFKMEPNRSKGNWGTFQPF